MVMRCEVRFGILINGLESRLGQIGCLLAGVLLEQLILDIHVKGLHVVLIVEQILEVRRLLAVDLPHDIQSNPGGSPNSHFARNNLVFSVMIAFLSS